MIAVTNGRIDQRGEARKDRVVDTIVVLRLKTGKKATEQRI